MIIYGSKAVHLQSFKLNKEVCKKCDSTGTLTLSIYSKHAHVFWIPLLPFAKLGITQCSNCKNTLTEKEMPQDLRNVYYAQLKTVRPPFWQYSGLAIIGILAVTIYISGRNNDSKEKTYSTSPQVGDVYEIDLGKGNYTSARVAQIEGDSVFVNQNSYIIDKQYKVYKLDVDSMYYDSQIGIQKDTITSWYNRKKIYSIKRK